MLKYFHHVKKALPFFGRPILEARCAHMQEI